MANVRATKVEIETLSQYTAEVKVRATKIELETLSGSSLIFPGPSSNNKARTQIIWVKS
jgi:hypothetical protein